MQSVGSVCVRACRLYRRVGSGAAISASPLDHTAEPGSSQSQSEPGVSQRGGRPAGDVAAHRRARPTAQEGHPRGRRMTSCVARRDVIARDVIVADRVDPVRERRREPDRRDGPPRLGSWRKCS